MIKFFIDQSKAFALISVLIIGVGIYYFIDGQKEALPNISFGKITIRTYAPGMSPEEVEKNITKKIEEAIDQIEGKDNIKSFSSEGSSVVVFSITPSSKIPSSKIVNEIKDSIDIVRSELPSDIEDPIVKENLISNSIVILEVGISGAEMAEVKNVIDQLSDEILKVKGVSQLRKNGYPEKQIWVEVDDKLLKNYDIEIGNISNAIKKNNVSTPSGVITVENQDYLIKTQSKIKTLEDIKNIVVRGNDDGKVVRIRDLAKVGYFLEDLDKVPLIKGKKGIILSIFKNSTGDVVKVSDKVKEIVENFKKEKIISDKMNVSFSRDVSFYVERRLNVLSQNATLGVFLVFLCLIIFFDFHITFWTAMGIPFAFCLAIIASYNLGITLNFVSMLGFIIVSGMIVDDAIIVSESIYKKQEEGLSSYQAAIAGTKAMVKPIMAIVSTSIVAFIPLLFLPGNIGKILSILPKVIIVSLLASFVECIVILPGHLAYSRKVAKNSTPKKRQWFVVVQKKYAELMTTFLKNPYKIFFIFTAIYFSLGIFSVLKTPFMLFQGTIDSVSINFTFSEKNTIEETTKRLEQIEQTLRKLESNKLVTEYSALAGTNVDKNAEVTEKNYMGNIMVSFDPKQDAKVPKGVAIIEEKLKELKYIEKYSISENRGGPPPGAPVSVYLYGDNLRTVKELSNKIKKIIEDIPNTKNTRVSLKDSKKEIAVNVDSYLASIYKINTHSVASAVSDAFSTTKTIRVNSMENNAESVDIVIKYPQEKIKNVPKDLKTLQMVSVKNQQGYNVPLKNFSQLEKQNTTELIKKKDQKKYIEIYSFLKDEKDIKYNGAFIRKLLEKKMQKLMVDYPKITYQFEGEARSSKEQKVAFSKALGYSIFGVFFVLVIFFRSFLQPFIIISILPFVMMGIFIGLFLHQTPNGLLPFLGGIALVGIAINDSFVMVAAINKLRRSGMDKIDAIKEGAISRLRPILTTSLTTVVGIAPLAYGIMGSEPFLEPMAVTMFSGLIFSTIFLILIFPLIYLIIDNIANAIMLKIAKKPYSLD